MQNETLKNLKEMCASQENIILQLRRELDSIKCQHENEVETQLQLV
jgi:hypothetical protein